MPAPIFPHFISSVWWGLMSRDLYYPSYSFISHFTASFPAVLPDHSRAFFQTLSASPSLVSFSQTLSIGEPISFLLIGCNFLQGTFHTLRTLVPKYLRNHLVQAHVCTCKETEDEGRNVTCCWSNLQVALQGWSLDLLPPASRLLL